MYRTPPTPLEGKIVSMRAPCQAAAGLGQLDVSELPLGDLSACGNIQTGKSCRGFEAGGILARCVCVNLSQTHTSLELKHVLSDVTGAELARSGVWNEADEATLLEWAEEAAAVFGPDVRRPWASGVVEAGDLLHRTQSGWAYPSGHGVLLMLEQAGCLGESGSTCKRFPSLSGAVDQLFSDVGPGDVLASIKTYPPKVGAASGTQPPIRSGEPPGTSVDVELRASSASLSPLLWVAAATVAGVAVWRMRGK